MKCIIKIDDKDIGETLYKINEPKIRKAVRTILFNEKGEIAILHKKIKMNISLWEVALKKTKIWKRL